MASNNFCLLFYVLYLRSRQKRLAIVLSRETKQRARLTPFGQIRPLGSLTHCCWKGIFLKRNAFAQCCCNSPLMHAALRHGTPFPFFDIAKCPLWSQKLVYQTRTRDQEIPKAGDMISYTLRLVTASSQLSLNSQTLTTIREEWMCGEFSQPQRVPRGKAEMIPYMAFILSSSSSLD